MRKCNTNHWLTSTSFFPFFQINNPCSDPEWNSCSVTSRTTPSAQSCSFTSCHFISCNNNENEPKGNGGAISYDVANGKLTVTSCYFSHCIAYSMDGGGVYSYNCNYVTISSCTFIDCHADATSRNSGGGGVLLRSIKKQPSISVCSFISCTSQDDGGGVCIWSSTVENPNRVHTDCIFVHCSIPKTNTNNRIPTGGGLLMWANTHAIKYSNVLFAHNEGYYGGAYATNSYSSAPNYLLSFCFFHMNEASPGNDLYFWSSPSNSPLFSCFSTTFASRISTGDDNWLPLTIFNHSINTPKTFTRTSLSQTTHNW